MDKKTKDEVEAIAWDATVGAGNDSGAVSYGKLRDRLGRDPTFEECKLFRAMWHRCVNYMASP